MSWRRCHGTRGKMGHVLKDMLYRFEERTSSHYFQSSASPVLLRAMGLRYVDNLPRGQ